MCEQTVVIEAARPAAKLIPLRPFEQLPEISLNRPLTLLGSGPLVHVRLRSHTISRIHAVCLNTEGRVYIHDIASRAGLFLNGRRVRYGILNDGDEVAVGKMAMRFCDADPVDAPYETSSSASAHLFVEGSPAPRALIGPILLIGRRESADLTLPGDSVSVAHAMLLRIDGKWLLRDLGSRTGTTVNGQRIQQIELLTGDSIRIGESNVRFQTTEPVEATVAPTIVVAHESDEIPIARAMPTVVMPRKSDEIPIARVMPASKHAEIPEPASIPLPIETTLAQRAPQDAPEPQPEPQPAREFEPGPDLEPAPEPEAIVEAEAEPVVGIAHEPLSASVETPVVLESPMLPVDVALSDEPFSFSETIVAPVADDPIIDPAVLETPEPERQPLIGIDAEEPEDFAATEPISAPEPERPILEAIEATLPPVMQAVQEPQAPDELVEGAATIEPELPAEIETQSAPESILSDIAPPPAPVVEEVAAEIVEEVVAQSSSAEVVAPSPAPAVEIPTSPTPSEPVLDEGKAGVKKSIKQDAVIAQIRNWGPLAMAVARDMYPELAPIAAVPAEPAPDPAPASPRKRFVWPAVLVVSSLLLIAAATAVWFLYLHPRIL